MADVPLTLVSETSSTITFSHPPVPGAEGYRYYADGEAVSRTFDPNKTTVKFSKGADRYRVVPLDVAELPNGFVWPAPVTPPPPPSSARKVAEAVYTGLGDVGDVPLWKPHGEQVKTDDRLTIVDDPLGQRGRVMRVNVRPGDNNVAGSGTNGERAEVYASSGATPDGEGDIIAYRTSFMLPSDFQSNGSDWNAVIQWHDTELGGQPNIFVWIKNGRDFGVRVFGGSWENGRGSWRGDFAIMPFERNRWYDVAFAEKLSVDPAKGRIVCAVNGQTKLDKPCSALYRNSGRYYKQGMYRVAQSYPVTLYDGPTSFWTAATVADALAAAIRA